LGEEVGTGFGNGEVALTQPMLFGQLITKH